MESVLIGHSSSSRQSINRVVSAFFLLQSFYSYLMPPICRALGSVIAKQMHVCQSNSPCTCVDSYQRRYRIASRIAREGTMMYPIDDKGYMHSFPQKRTKARARSGVSGQGLTSTSSAYFINSRSTQALQRPFSLGIRVMERAREVGS
ncbi:uncharacterized protein MONOS_11246 [Monocercomonoides exilis]|uniref:uncharacterized protein n=1 Tax=Monocercomonoides exilis TaxID=2049356 RepID=UPI00355AC1EC|nr:hypothetical protein MONOS_11246 [Monocercomonoides exilis]|eukprot:MONOS_11246.1-p1 / transcript=MONOS_11246.1 / gene=MONOS_11246 / organism=Monocercomonoides_exilis_PA203 / gene_product=unspecified product / transcript_product=unspecified product / location=Mono_scaffold00554:4400-5222(+) / protein_length=148 / sequence_SO=supercontig / SO=protein_coding / is_pseudo=false